MIPFGEWRPDLPDFQNPGATVTTNVIPDFASYRPIGDTESIDTTVGSEEPTTQILGGINVDISASDSAVHVGTAGKLLRYIMTTGAASYADVTRASGGAYTAAQWRWAQFGTRLVAVNGSDVAQSYVEGSSTDYAALAGSPPAAPRTVCVVRDFLQMAPASNVLSWSGINDPEDWTPSVTTQSDTQTIPEGGIIQGQVGGQYGIIFMESAIYRQSYIGPPFIFQFDKISENTGLFHDGTLATHDGMIFFWSGEAFLMLVGGQQIVPIGMGKVDRFFGDDLGKGGVKTKFLSSCIDPSTMTYNVLYLGDRTASPGLDLGEKKILTYHWPSQKWSVTLVGDYAEN